MAVPDRVEQLNKQNVVTGIDFIRVHPTQVTLDVFFLRPPLTLSDPPRQCGKSDRSWRYSHRGRRSAYSIFSAAAVWAVFSGRTCCGSGRSAR